jgi:hypothetical protein
MFVISKTQRNADIVNVLFGTELPVLFTIKAASDSHGSFSGITQWECQETVVICARSKPRANTWCLWRNASKFICISTLKLYSELQEISLSIHEVTLGSQAKIMTPVITAAALAIIASGANSNRRYHTQHSYPRCIHTADEFPCIK